MILPARPDSELRYRLAELGEARLLAELGARTFADAFGARNEPEDMAAYLAAAFSVERIEAELRQPESFFLLAFDPTLDSSAPIGYCRLVGGSQQAAIAGPDPVELHRLYVDGAMRGAGYGSALMWDAMELARDSGYRTLWLGVWDENRAARRFYERWGFEVVGSHDFMLGAALQRDLLMACSLGPALDAD